MAQELRLALSLGYAPSEVVSLGGGGLVKISGSCLRDAVCLSPNAMSGIVGVGLSKAWVRSAAAYVAASFDDSLGKVSVVRKNSVVLENISFVVLGM